MMDQRTYLVEEVNESQGLDLENTLNLRAKEGWLLEQAVPFSQYRWTLIFRQRAQTMADLAAEIRAATRASLKEAKK